MSDWGGLAGAVEAASKINNRTGCSVGELIASIPTADRAKVQAVIEEPGAPATVVQRVIKSRVGDKTPSTSAFARHRRGDCKCPRGAK